MTNSFSRIFRILIWIVIAAAPAALPIAGQQPAAHSLSDVIERIQTGKTSLSYSDKQGYLPALLKELDVPVSSQTLVFSKSSFQLMQIAPEAPRAIYFNDDVYVGWVDHAQFIELAEVDPKTGPVFYTLSQEDDKHPAFQPQKEECLICHDTFQTTDPVPRLLMLSVLPNANGNAINRLALITNDESPLRERWGGWYVTGRHGAQRHLGNTIVRTRPEDVGEDMKKFVERMNLDAGANVTDLHSRFDAADFLSPYSDIVALMVLGHQTHVHNMITSGVYEMHDAVTKGMTGKMDEIVKDAGDRIVRAMMFVNAAPLTDPVQGVSGFAEDFVKRGPRDSKGRSLRDLDLQRRLLRYPLSYLVYSKSFDNMPAELKNYVCRRFREVLMGEDQSPEFAHISMADRQAILEILQETKPEVLNASK